MVIAWRRGKTKSLFLNERAQKDVVEGVVERGLNAWEGALLNTRVRGVMRKRRGAVLDGTVFAARASDSSAVVRKVA